MNLEGDKETLVLSFEQSFYVGASPKPRTQQNRPSLLGGISGLHMKGREVMEQKNTL